MSAQIIRFPRGAKRGWVIYIDAAGQSTGHLFVDGKWAGTRTETGDLFLVQEAIRFHMPRLPAFYRHREAAA